MANERETPNLTNQAQPPLDFGGEVYYAFAWLPDNKRLNDEIYRRAIERAVTKPGTDRAV